MHTQTAPDTRTEQNLLPPLEQDLLQHRIPVSAEQIRRAADASIRQICQLLAGHFSLTAAEVSLPCYDLHWQHAGAELPPVPLPPLFETPLQTTPDHLLIIEDLHQHPEHFPQLHQLRPEIRFYAGAAICDAEQNLLGYCSLSDTRPRPFKRRHQRQLIGFARLISTLLHQQLEFIRLKETSTNFAYYDPMTGLPNQKLLLSQLEQRLQHGEENPQVIIAVIHLSRFAELLHARGKQAADQVMFYFALRLRGSLPLETQVARIDGAKFAVITRATAPANNRREAQQLAQHLLQLCEQEISVGGDQVHVPVRIGLVQHFSQDGYQPDSTAETLLEQAKAASRQNKSINYFTLAHSSETNRRFQLEQYLQQALQENLFSVEYQPIVNIQNGELCSLEALLRLHLEGSSISPAEFIPIAEETGLIMPIGQWLLNHVSQQISEWGSIMRRKNITVAVNLSGKQMALTNLKQQVFAAINRYQLQPGQLQLEVTETSLMQQIDRAIDNMQEIRQRGISFSLDDFGTGYSSLSYLQRLPVSKVKLDRAFIQHVDSNQQDRVLARHIVNLCHELGKTTVAEGIETLSQLSALRQLGCHLGQGFYFSRPLKPEQLSLRFAQNHLTFP